MPKNDNAHSIRMVSSLEKNAGKDAGKDAAREMEEKYPLSMSANIEKKFESIKSGSTSCVIQVEW